MPLLFRLLKFVFSAGLIIVLASCSKGYLNSCQQVASEWGIENIPGCSFHYKNMENTYDNDGFLVSLSHDENKEKVVLLGDEFLSDEFKPPVFKIDSILKELLESKFEVYNLGIRDVRFPLLTIKAFRKIKELKPKYVILIISGSNMIGRTLVQPIDPFNICPITEFVVAHRKDYLEKQLKEIFPFLKELSKVTKENYGHFNVVWTAHKDFSIQGIFSSVHSCSLFKKTLPYKILGEKEMRNIFFENEINFEYIPYPRELPKGDINMILAGVLKNMNAWK